MPFFGRRVSGEDRSRSVNLEKLLREQELTGRGGDEERSSSDLIDHGGGNEAHDQLRRKVSFKASRYN